MSKPVTYPYWIRMSTAINDATTGTVAAQDEILQIVGCDGEKLISLGLNGASGRIPKAYAMPITNPLRLPHERVFCSIAPYEAQQTDDLSFSIYTLIVTGVDTGNENWISGVVTTDAGKRLGTSGSCPLSYVRQLSGFTPPSATPTPPPVSMTMMTTNSMTPSFTTDFTSIQMRATENVKPYARAVHPFVGEFSNELSFAADSIISLTSRIDASWLEGSVDGKTGIFPQSFVQIIVPLPGEDSGDAEGDNDDKRSSSHGDGVGFAIVRHNFDASRDDELTVRMGDSLRIIKMMNADWVMCCDPNNDKMGLVPVSFLELYLDEDDDEGNQQEAQPTATVSDPNQTFSTLHDPSFEAPQSIPDWRTSTRREDTTFASTSSFSAPNIVPASSSKNSWATFGEDWLLAEKKTAAPTRPPPPKVNNLSSLKYSENEIVSVTQMFGMPERQSSASPLPASTSTPSLNQQQMRTKVLEELISSELQFITDINSYVDAVDNSTRLSSKQKVIMKNGCAQILQLSTNLVQSLTNAQCQDPDDQAIGAVFLNFRKAFSQTYGYYFRNIEHINALMNSAKTDAKMETALRELVVRMRAGGSGVIDAATAVGRPVQRCLKYPLFLGELAKYTPLQHSDHPKLLEAVKQMSNLGQKMNESKRRKELTKKYSEEQQTSTSFGEMLSKFTLHSIKKKSNRFTYRMGSSLGVVKLTRDMEFDRLVCDLDTIERRLVRFNYMLVIYRKKMFHQTRTLFQKIVIEPRKKSISGVHCDLMLATFLNMTAESSGILNIKVRDPIVKALRSIPKKLIKKRNDKLMDYEAIKSSNKSNPKSDLMTKFKDFEALNTQVKQVLPKVIEQLNAVLLDSMVIVHKADEELVDRMRKKWKDEADSNKEADRHTSALIIPGMVCFANYFDPNRLKPMQSIVNRANKQFKYGSESAQSPLATGSTISSEQKQQLSELFAQVEKESAEEQAKAAPPPTAKRFRAQTFDERRELLIKANEKCRRPDIYRCTTMWPDNRKSHEEVEKHGKQLIVNMGDAVLVVRRDPGPMWLCYNGYYNAMLPNKLLTSYFGVNDDGSCSGVNVPPNTRPRSTPPKSSAPPSVQKPTNLIDLDDDLMGLDLNFAPLTPMPLTLNTMVPTQASVPALTPSPVPVPVNMAPKNAEPAPINWGPQSLAIRTPSLPNLNQQQFSPAFPVTFDDTPTEPAPTITTTAMVHLPPAPRRTAPVPNNVPLVANQNPVNPTKNQYQNTPRKSVFEHYQDLMDKNLTSAFIAPTEPSKVVELKPELLFGGKFVPLAPCPLGLSKPLKPVVLPPPAAYDAVPGGPVYSPIPMPALQPTKVGVAAAQQAYDMPPSNMSMSYASPPSGGQYDSPPSEDTARYSALPPIGAVRVLYDFSPIGPSQMAITVGEIVELLKASDDEDNKEWVLVRRPMGGKIGFVPAAYVSQYM